MTLDELEFRLNGFTGEEGTTFDALVTEDGILEVVCSNNDEFPIHVTQTETQLLSVTALFRTAEVLAGKQDEVNEAFLRLSPAVPLSSIGLQGDTYILFGAMALDTRFEIIAHELEVQAENTVDVLEVVEHLLA
ncbi:MAG: DUF2170 family protein [Gammaproteobacteria bacterium]|nr:DUF2170 family protein [Gammaproteobacteria bacterium]